MPNSTDPSSEQQTLTLQQALDLGVRHHTAGDFSKAENIYQQILQADPNHIDALHLLGVIFHQAGENERAVDLITRALGVKPDYAEAHSNLGNVLREIGRLQEAVVSCQKAIDIKPDYAEAHNNLGLALLDLGKLEAAVANCRKALAIKPDYAEAHNNLGAVLKELGKLDEAIANYQKALAIKPDYAQARSNLGVSLVKLGRLDEAGASFGEALKLTPIDEPYFPSFSFMGHPERHFWMMGTIALLTKLDRPVTMLEVGTWLGSSLLTWDQCITAFHSKGGNILCVDPWKPYLNPNDLLKEEDIYEAVNAVADLGVAYDIFCHNKNTATCKVDHCRGVSKEILPGLESGSFDIVYIDGSHYYDDVVKDIREGCRLVRDGGYICGDDLEIQWNDANQEHAQRHTNEDYVQDPEGRSYHPGVTAAVYDVLGEVTCHKGYWVMQKQDGKPQKVLFEGFDYFTPSHFSTGWKNRFKDYVGTLLIVDGSQIVSQEES